MEPPVEDADECLSGARDGKERAGTRHRELRVVDALPLHLCLVVCDPGKVTEKWAACQGIKRASSALPWMSDATSLVGGVGA
jgi:hypothetical protein